MTGFVTVGAVLALLAGGCDRAQPAPAFPPPAVSVSRPVERVVTEMDEYTGRLEAVERVDVRARVGGLIRSAPFTEGSIVKAGDVLFEIDDRPYQAELDRARARVAQADAQVQLTSDELVRITNLRRDQAASEKEFLDARYAKQAADAQAAAARAEVRTAELNLEWTKVKAEISGRISDKRVTPGNLITGGTAQATLLTTIASRDPIYCYVDADERAILKYQRLSRSGARQSARDVQIPAWMALADETEFEHQGVIDFVDNRLEPGTGTLQARAAFANPNDRFTPGLFARLRVPGSAPYKAILVADEAVGTDQDQKFVLVVGPDKVAKYRPVKVGALFEGQRVVEGVSTDEWVIVNGLLRVRPGSPVEPRQVPMPSRPSAPTTRMVTPGPTTTQPANAPGGPPAATQPGGQPARPATQPTAPVAAATGQAVPAPAAFGPSRGTGIRPFGVAPRGGDDAIPAAHAAGDGGEVAQ